MNKTFEPGEYFIYVNGDINGRYELGKVKRQRDETTYFCYYHEGDTAAATPVSCMHKLTNAYIIRDEGFAKAGQEWKVMNGGSNKRNELEKNTN